MHRNSFWAGIGLMASLACPIAHAESRCEALTHREVASATITSAREVAAGVTDKLPLPAFCQVLGYVTTPGLEGEPDNRVNFEVDLPLEGWNGKLYFAGGGGFSGGHSEKGPLASGYASAYTDTGHRASTGSDATWAADSLTKKVDFFYRGIHVGTVAAKEVIKAYYSDPLKRAYFVGCSTGGKQALMEAQRYPDDYDGIVAGAPALDYTGLMLQFSWNQRALLRSGDFQLTAAKLALVAATVARACDAADGVADGLISDPLHCHFDPASLQCKSGDGPSCLSKGQVDTLRKIYAGPVTPTGKPIFPGIPAGHEDSNDHVRWLIGGDTAVAIEFAYQEQFLRYLAFPASNPQYDWRTFDFNHDLKKIERLAKLHNATDPDLSRFQRHGGKLLMYSGWADPVVSPLRTVQYFEEVKARMGPRTEEFVRLFMAPGMDHCGNGPGPNQFDKLGPLDRWVEQGTPPQSMIATHRNGDMPDRTRPLCPYPLMAKWKGSGSTDDAANFVCAAEKPQ